MAPAAVELKQTAVSVDISKSELDVASSGISVELSTTENKHPALVPLKKPPSVLRAVNVHEIDVSDSETEEEKRDDAFDTKYKHQVYEATSPTTKGKTTVSKTEVKAGESTATAAKGELKVFVTKTVTTTSTTTTKTTSQSPKASL